MLQHILVQPIEYLALGGKTYLQMGKKRIDAISQRKAAIYHTFIYEQFPCISKLLFSSP